ncbi:11435_t:CDS:2 [Ambispora gerdemannii]|uniref:11435_t:CDS:1 n=1 Tax=Ambispora gerdemannii TaxID=144530 RepID=A0A9N8V486_9GLOM|nr:11435_t:CDS:2 [Ambispora gerdemannii]
MSSSVSSSNSTTSLVIAPRLKTYNNDNAIVISNQNQEDKQLQLSPLDVINEVKVMDVNGRVVHYSLIRRKDVWFLDVSNLDAMDPAAVFQYVAYRSPPQHDLVLTRVPELRHLVYVKYDEEGRPYPVKMRRVLKANYLKKKRPLSKVLQEEIIQEEIIQEGVMKEGKTITTTEEEHYQQINSDNSSESSTTPTTKSRSLWDTFSISLIKASTQSTS